MRKLNFESWGRAREILTGGSRSSVSRTAVARAAGVSLREMDAWVERSRLEDPGDEPWVWEIAKVVDEAMEWQAGALEDEAWRRVFAGNEVVRYDGDGVEQSRQVSFDNSLLEKMLRVRDGRYIEKSASVNLHLNADVDFEALERKWEARKRMEKLRSDEVVVDSRGSVVVSDSDADAGRYLDAVAVEQVSKRRAEIELLGDAPDLDDLFDDL